MAGVGHYQRYQLKKTALSHLENLGTPVSTILKFSGHSNISTVMNHYAFSTDEADQRALAGLDSLRPQTKSTE
jgi:integrase